MPLKNVSRETLVKLRKYHDILLKWQRAVNLVSPKTIPEAWQRHFEDSAQIAQFLPPQAKTLLDLGSGAGFPGLVLAILRPDMDVHLVESDEKKCQFLRNVSRETLTPVTIHNCRIENLEAGIIPDIITARALADLAALLGYALPYAEKNPALVLLFSKGEKADAEIAMAQESFSFEITTHPSLTHDGAQILEIWNLRRI